MRLSDRVAIVTGAARGIGRACAARLTADGAAVVLADTDSQGVEEAASGLDGAIGIEADVSVPEQVQALVDRSAARFGRIDILVNNAGIYPEIAWDDLDFGTWRRVMATNLDSVFLMSKAVHPHMRAAGYGRIVNLASELMQSPPPGLVHYVASKGGVFGFTRALATELGVDGITVNSVAPGLIGTETVTEGIPEDVIDLIVGSQAIPRLGMPDDVASVVAYLATEEAGFVTGSMITVGGGRHRH